MEAAISRGEHEKLINEVRNYDLTHVVSKFAQKAQLQEHNSKEYENEFKKFLILCAIFPDKEFDMTSPMVDELWHTFILHTRDYEKFCREVAGRFIHHVPASPEEKLIPATATFQNCYKEFFNEVPPVHIWGGGDAKGLEKHCGIGPIHDCRSAQKDCRAKDCRAPASCRGI